MERRCEKCEWWEADEEYVGCTVGYCHVGPPTIPNQTCEGEPVNTFRATYSDDWCGEFKERNSA